MAVYGKLRDQSTLTQLLSLSGLLLLSFLVMGAIGLGLGYLLYADSSSSLASLSQDIDFIKINQIFNSSGLFLIPPLLFWYLMGDQQRELWQKPRIPMSYVWAVVLLVLSRPFVAWLMEINTAMHLPAYFAELEASLRHEADVLAALTDRVAYADNLTTLLYNLFIMAILPAVAEELFFRGTVQRILIRLGQNPHWAIFISALTFSLIHFNYYGIFPIFALGIFLGYLYYLSGSLWPAIVFHFINNGATLLYLYFSGNSVADQELEQLPIILVAFSALASIFCVQMLHKINLKAHN